MSDSLKEGLKHTKESQKGRHFGGFYGYILREKCEKCGH